MGTAGLLTRAYSNGNILPNNIYGCETEKDTIKFGECSILLTTNEFNSNIEKCDSLCNNPNLFNNNFNLEFTNPPFGTKMKYEELKIKFNDYKETNFKDSSITFESIYPYKTNNGACLFIQHCMYMLKEKGTCAIVLPDGELFSGKTFSKFRKFMCENINIIKIINIEGGSFEHTSIKTSVIIFQKDGSTKNIEYMSINKECNEVKSDVIVNINNIINENYSFNLNNYIKKKSKINSKFEIKKLREVCEVNQGTYIKADMKIKGEYPVYGGGNISYYINQYNREDEIIIAKDGISIDCVRYEKNKFFLNHHAWTLICKEGIIKNYLFYYLQFIQDKLFSIAKGSAQLGINQENFYNIEIPIPSLEIQEKIVKDVEIVSKSIETIKLRITQLKDESKLFMNFYRKTELNEINKNAEMKKLGDICEFLPKSKRNAKYGNNKGLYPFFKSSMNVDSYVNEPDYNEESLIIGDGGVANINYGIKFSTSDHCYIIQNSNKLLFNLKYIYYYIKNNLDIMENLYTGIAIKNISKYNLMNIEIPIPSLEDQKKFINIYKEKEEIHKIKFLDKIEDENKHIELLNEISKNIFNQ